MRRQHGELDERGLVRRGNVAYAAGLASLMAGLDGAATWFRRAAVCWRDSWDAGPAIDAWGRPIGALKASLLADDAAAADELAYWTLELGTATAESPIGRYAAALALLVLARFPEARHVAESLRERDDFPHDVADALATIAAHDVVGYVEAVESVDRVVRDPRRLPRGSCGRRHRARSRRARAPSRHRAAASRLARPAAPPSPSRPARSRDGTRS